MHESIEALSAYVDGELPSADRARVESHLAACADCTGRVALLERAARSVAALPEVVPTAVESRRIRQEVLGRSRRRRPLGRLRPAWAGAAGALALVVAGVFAGSSLLRSGGPAEDRAGGGASLAEAGVVPLLATDEDVRAFVLGDIEVRRRAGLGTAPPAPGPEAKQDLGDRMAEAPAAPALAPDDARTTTGTARGVLPSTPVPAAAREATDCLRAQAVPTGARAHPDLTRAVSFGGRPAWLLVFTAPAATPGAAGRVYVHVVARDSCELLSYQFIGSP